MTATVEPPRALLTAAQIRALAKRLGVGSKLLRVRRRYGVAGRDPRKRLLMDGGPRGETR